MERPAGHALLIEGTCEGDARATAPRLAPVAEALRAGCASWIVRRIGPGALPPGALRDELDDAVRATELVLAVVCGAVIRGRGPGLRIGHGAGHEAAFDLAELAETLHRGAARQTTFVVALDGDGATSAEEVAGILAREIDAVIVSVGTPEPVLADFVEALRGAARDVRIGALTLASLAAHLARHGVTIRLPNGQRRDAPWFEPPSLERMWHLGWSTRVGHRPALPAGTGAGDPLLGTVLPGRFRVDARIAAGSFGTVYRGHQLAVGRDVAIKVLRAGVDPFSEDGRLFVHEIQAVARIDHRNVVRVYQADVTTDGRLFFAMELLPGRDLQAIVTEGTLEPARAIALVTQLLGALEAAHQVGLVHADVKPGNAIVVPGRDGERLVLVDFGLARLRRSDGEVASVGGTPAFMAPEQLRAGRVDARSDVFSAALVLVMLLTGWHRRRAADLAPPGDVLAAVGDPVVRAALVRALAIAPGERFGSAAELAAALSGLQVAGVGPPQRPPFHGLAPLTQVDRGHLHGRERELARLTELVFHKPLVIITAPSGVGKTSLLRAGLVPRLDALGAGAHYLSCRNSSEAAAAAAITTDAATIADALEARGAATLTVLVVDQVEDALDVASAYELIEHVVTLARRGRPLAHAVLSVREDFLARLLDRLPDRGDGTPIMRVGPLDDGGARDAIVRPLAERRLTIAPDLLDALIADLVAAGLRLSAELGWAVPQPVYPLHLQLACTVLYERLPPGESTLALAHYRAAGGFDAIVGEHLERVIDGFRREQAAVAREVLLALVGTNQLRATRTEDELAERLGGPDRQRLPEVLETLRRQGIIVPAKRPDGELVWELVHDSLVRRVHTWLDRHDRGRRDAMDVVRHHLRRAENRSLLGPGELRELARHPGVVEELEREWRSAGHDLEWGPRELLVRSRIVARRSRIAAIALVTAVVAGVGITAYLLAARAIEQSRRDRNLGRVTLEFTAFDWDASRQVAVAVPWWELPALGWALHEPAAADHDQPGERLATESIARSSWIDGRRDETFETRGGPAVLVVDGRGRPGETCAPSIIPLTAIPGYAQTQRTLRVDVPTCRATRAGTVEIPAGEFVFGGPGEPPQDNAHDAPARAVAETRRLAGYRIDRTEVTNAAFAWFARMAPATNLAPPSYPTNSNLPRVADPRSPVTNRTWREASVYCRYLGMRLPTSEQWEKAMRGGIEVGGRPNAFPHRNYPWGITARGDEANLKRAREIGPQPVGSFPADRSPYGVLDLAGNVTEWIGSAETGVDDATFFARATRVTRGGNWAETPPAELADYLSIENGRAGSKVDMSIGWRCAD